MPRHYNNSNGNGNGGNGGNGGSAIPGWLRSLVPGADDAAEVKEKSPREIDRIRREMSNGKRRSGSGR